LILFKIYISKNEVYFLKALFFIILLKEIKKKVKSVCLTAATAFTDTAAPTLTDAATAAFT
jgi:hypothetical protein